MDTREVIASAKTLARMVLVSRALLPRHKRRILSVVQWLISEVDGKYTTRYRSKKVVDLANRYLKAVAKKTRKTQTRKVKAKARKEFIQHEHVNTRKDITDKMLEQPANFESLLDQVIGCVVTRKEHGRLRSGRRGWGRYRRTGVSVYDMAYKSPKLKPF
jgi:uncharacterized membrane protein YheB (UPF0754 family)